MMKRNIDEVRRSLAKRKAKKLRRIQNRPASRSVNPAPATANPKHPLTEQSTPLFVKQLIASGIIFLVVLFFNHFATPESNVRQWGMGQMREIFHLQLLTYGIKSNLDLHWDFLLTNTDHRYRTMMCFL